MKVMKKTREAAEELGVSLATVKRWVAFFHESFQKDRFGHYVFSEEDILKLRQIKEQLEQGRNLNQICLASDSHGSELKQSNGPSANEQLQEMMGRIVQVEHKLAQKADEVVSVQLLQHRRELEEIRKAVQELAASLESIQESLAKSRQSGNQAGTAAVTPIKRRKLLGTFFGF